MTLGAVPPEATAPAFGLRPGCRLVLASGSASRRLMLEQAGLAFAIARPGIDEDALKESLRGEGVPASEAALVLAEAKALRVSARDPEALVIGADQLLVCEGGWFDKPADRAAAAASLAALAGRRHELFTAAVVLKGGVRIWQALAVPALTMHPLSPAAISAYLDAAGPAVLASVGAYQVEGLGVRLFARIEGDQFAIRGLPLLELLGFLRQHGALLP